MNNHAAETSAGDMDNYGSESAFVNEDLSGREIAGCQILHKLGQGAMGAVYYAEQVSLRRKVAFKVLDPKFSRDITYIERFEREAQAAARLAHFNIVQVFDYGRSGEIYYIVNEYVDGGDVQDLIDAEGVVDPIQALDITIQSCNGLVIAQSQNVIHRDIKPENLMLTKDGVVKIADFGLAKVVTDDAAVTQSGMIVGTPFYMSPEQAKGLTLDTRSDIYSLGVTLFHMVTGQIPFDADSVIGVLLKQISAERPDPVGINPSLPASVGKTIMQMMAREPENRFSSATELVRILEKHKQELKHGAESVQIEVPSKPVDRSERYKLLRKSRIIRLGKRQVPPAAADQMMALLKGDAGVFIETDMPLDENDIVEVRFTAPGRDEVFRGIGVVRWVGDNGPSAGMGVTFLKVSTVPRGTVSTRTSVKSVHPSATEEAAPASSRKVSPAEAIRVLTKTPLHCRLLRYYYANSGQTVDVNKIANALGVGTRMLGGTLAIYEQLGLIKRHHTGTVDLKWPDDKGLQREIVSWVSKYGLL
ncbi:MAG: protein kinase [Planctomycetes bacterium]|nr:protein kinase [Planctomycetota bacterium]